MAGASADKYLPTGRRLLWQRLRRLAWAVPVLAVALSLALGGGTASVAAACVSLVSGLIVGLPLALLWLGVCSLVLLLSREEASVVPAGDVAALREHLDGMAPATLSLLYDYGLEPTRAIPACLLRLRLMGIVKGAEGDEVDTRAADAADLPGSDMFLLRRILNSGIQVGDHDMWERAAVSEALRSPYLCPYGFGRSSALPGLAGVFLEVVLLPFSLVAAAMAVACAVLAAPWGAGLSAFLAAGGGTAEFVAATEADPSLLGVFMVVSVSALAGCCAAAHALCRGIAAYLLGRDRANVVRRTPEGAELASYVRRLAECVAGFDGLPAEERDALVAWDGFLVYAVLLDDGHMARERILPLRDVSL